MDRLIIPNKILGGYNEITKVELLQTPYIVEQELVKPIYKTESKIHNWKVVYNCLRI